MMAGSKYPSTKASEHIRWCIVSTILCHALTSCRTAETGQLWEPTPAELWPVKIESGASESFDIQVGRTVIGLLNNLSYLMTVDENRFAESINRLASDFSDTSSGRAATIRNVRALASSWNTGNAQ